MKTAIGILAMGMGLMLIADTGTAQAQPVRAERFSKGVRMKCRVASGACSFRNDRPRGRKCTYTVSYVAHSRRRGRVARTHSGRVFVQGGARQRQTFHFGRSRLRRITGASLQCQRQRRHRGR